MFRVDALTDARLDAPLYDRQSIPMITTSTATITSTPTSHATNQLTHTREPKGPPHLSYSNQNNGYSILCNGMMGTILMVTGITLMVAATTTTSRMAATTSTSTTTDYSF